MPKRIECRLDGHAGEWIEVTEQISIKDWRDWKLADQEETQKMMMRLITAWLLKDMRGKDVTFISNDTACLDPLPLQMLPWLIRAVTDALIEEQRLPPNASSPSPTPPKE